MQELMDTRKKYNPNRKKVRNHQVFEELLLESECAYKGIFHIHQLLPTSTSYSPPLLQGYSAHIVIELGVRTPMYFTFNCLYLSVIW